MGCKGRGERNTSRLHAARGTQHGTGFYYLEILTWAKTKSQILNYYCATPDTPIWVILFFLRLYLFEVQSEREKDNMSEGWGGRSRLPQVGQKSLLLGLTPGPWVHDLSWKQMFNQLTPSGTLNLMDIWLEFEKYKMGYRRMTATLTWFKKKTNQCKLINLKTLECFFNIH